MIPPDIKIVDLGALNYPRLFTLLTGKISTEKTKDATEGPLLLVYSGLKLLYCLDLDTFEMKKVNYAGISRLEDIAKETGYPRIIAISDTALMRIFDSAGRAMKHDDDFLRQLAVFLDAISKEIGKTIHLYPRKRKSSLFFISFFLKRILPVLIPKEAILLLIINEGKHIWASIAFGFKKKKLSLITTLDSIVPLENDPLTDAIDQIMLAFSTRYNIAPRYVVIERLAAEKLISRRFNPAEMLLLFNRGELKIEGFPKRWQIYCLLLSFLIWFFTGRSD